MEVNEDVCGGRAGRALLGSREEMVGVLPLPQEKT